MHSKRVAKIIQVLLIAIGASPSIMAQADVDRLLVLAALKTAGDHVADQASESDWSVDPLLLLNPVAEDAPEDASRTDAHAERRARLFRAAGLEVADVLPMRACVFTSGLAVPPPPSSQPVTADDVAPSACQELRGRTVSVMATPRVVGEDPHRWAVRVLSYTTYSVRVEDVLIERVEGELEVVGRELIKYTAS